MRPFVVIALVLAAGAAVVALVGLRPGSGGRGTDAVHQTVPAVAQTPAPAPAADVEPAESFPYTAPLPVAEAHSTRTPEGVGELAREAVGEATSWPNGLRGRILSPSGEPVAGAKVSLRRQALSSHMAVLQVALAGDGSAVPARHATSDAEGRYELASLAPESDYLLTVEHDFYSRAERPLIALLPEGFTELDVALALGHVLTGRVTDPSGAAIADAQLELMPNFMAGLPDFPGKQQDFETLRTRSATDGSYTFANVTNGTLTVICRAPGFGTQSQANIPFHGKPEAPIVRDFRMLPALSIAGRVLSPARAPVAGATVEALYFAGGQNSRGRAVSGADGRFKIEDLLEAPYMVIAQAEGYTQFKEGGVEAGRQDLTIELAEQGALQGRVLDGATGPGLTEFALELRQVDDRYGYGRSIKTRSYHDAKDGAFELPGVEGGKYVVRATAAGFAPTYSAPIDVTQGLTTADVLVHMSKGGVLTGVVVDDRTGEPVAGAKVATFDNNYVENPLAAMFGSLVARTTTDRSTLTGPDGAFRLELLSPELYQVQITHPTYTSAILRDLRVQDGADTRVPTVRVGRGAIVRGVVYGADGEPLRGARVEMRGASRGDLVPRMNHATTDSSGRFVLDRVAAGAYTISATSSLAGSTENPFLPIVEAKNSEVALSVIDGREYTQDLRLGGT